MFAILLLVLTACAPRGALIYVPSGVTPQVTQRVFVATNRNLAPPGDPEIFVQSFGATRDERLRYAVIDVAIPQQHVTGQIEWPDRNRRGAQDTFLVAGSETLDGAQAFSDALRTGQNGQGAPLREVVLFVHGYNTNNAEAVYLLAQMAHDFEIEAPVAVFSWPSAGARMGYAYDRDSVIFSRDALESVLSDLTSDGWRVFVVGHSMGTQLVMETLRQLSISGRRRVLNGLNGVALIAPDIDADVFLKQAQRIDPLPDPFAVLVSRYDRALNLSAWLTGKPGRLGSLTDVDGLSGLPVDVIDLSSYRAGDRSGHLTAFSDPAAIRMLRGLAPY